MAKKVTKNQPGERALDDLLAKVRMPSAHDMLRFEAEARAKKIKPAGCDRCASCRTGRSWEEIQQEIVKALVEFREIGEERVRRAIGLKLMMVMLPEFLMFRIPELKRNVIASSELPSARKKKGVKKRPEATVFEL